MLATLKLTSFGLWALIKISYLLLWAQAA